MCMYKKHEDINILSKMLKIIKVHACLDDTMYCFPEKSYNMSRLFSG